MNGGWGISNEIALRWMPLDLTDDKSTLVQVMAWCRQATSHYLSQCWPRSMSPNDVTRPQWANTMSPRQIGLRFTDIVCKLIFLWQAIIWTSDFLAHKVINALQWLSIQHHWHFTLTTITLWNPFAYPGINITRPFCYLRGKCSFWLI